MIPTYLAVALTVLCALGCANAVMRLREHLASYRLWLRKIEAEAVLCERQAHAKDWRSSLDDLEKTIKWRKES